MQERLQDLSPKATPAERKQWKELLIDIWLFGDSYSIPRLQNQAMKQLTTLFVTPSLLVKADIEYIWAREAVSEQIKDLVICTLVAQLETPNAVKSIDHHEDLATLPKFTAKLYKALHLWLTFEVPAKAKKNKWAVMLQSEGIQKALRAVETKRTPTAAAAGGAPARPFVPGKVIEID